MKNIRNLFAACAVGLCMIFVAGCSGNKVEPDTTDAALKQKLIETANDFKKDSAKDTAALAAIDNLVKERREITTAFDFLTKFSSVDLLSEYKTGPYASGSAAAGDLAVKAEGDRSVPLSFDEKISDDGRSIAISLAVDQDLLSFFGGQYALNEHNMFANLTVQGDGQASAACLDQDVCKAPPKHGSIAEILQNTAYVLAYYDAINISAALAALPAGDQQVWAKSVREGLNRAQKDLAVISDQYKAAVKPVVGFANKMSDWSGSVIHFTRREAPGKDYHLILEAFTKPLRGPYNIGVDYGMRWPFLGLVQVAPSPTGEPCVVSTIDEPFIAYEMGYLGGVSGFVPEKVAKSDAKTATLRQNFLAGVRKREAFERAANEAAKYVVDDKSTWGSGEKGTATLGLATDPSLKELHIQSDFECGPGPVGNRRDMLLVIENVEDLKDTSLGDAQAKLVCGPDEQTGPLREMLNKLHTEAVKSGRAAAERKSAVLGRGDVLQHTP